MKSVKSLKADVHLTNIYNFIVHRKHTSALQNLQLMVFWGYGRCLNKI